VDGDVTDRFTQLIQGPDPVVLDEAALLIAAHAHPVDVPARLQELDTLAGAVPAPGADVLARFLYRERGFTGNRVDYGDPRNSYLDAVLDRRVGIPITLSVLMIEVGRRCGVELVGVGMPGHFLVACPAAGGEHDGVWYDPFGGGARLDVAGCLDRFAETHPRDAFRPEYLAPVSTRAILDRMLANLQHSFLAREPAAAAWVVRLRLAFPNRPVGERAELAAALARIGRFGEAAVVLDAAADEVDGSAADQLRAAARNIRARAN
jgi:regulator of sirC expression with transglutaminase-like and TPR domain